MFPLNPHETHPKQRVVLCPLLASAAFSSEIRSTAREQQMSLPGTRHSVPENKNGLVPTRSKHTSLSPRFFSVLWHSDCCKPSSAYIRLQMSAGPVALGTAWGWFCLPMTFILSFPFGHKTAPRCLMGNILTGPSFHAVADDKHSSARCRVCLPRSCFYHFQQSVWQELAWQESRRVSKVQLSSLAGADRERMTANHETYLLMAGTQNDMEDWVKSIRRVIWAPFGGGESAREHARLQAAQRHRGDFVVSRSQPEFEEEETRTV